LPLVVAGFAALWVLLALYTRAQCSWMAVLGAVDVLWVLGLCGPGRPVGRGILATVATLAIIGIANWCIAAAHVGGALGLMPWESALRLGTHHALTLGGLANRWQDAVWMGLALAVAAGGPWLSARLRATSAR
jgi:hypothetical protein